jgi:hypothetical protein
MRETIKTMPKKGKQHWLAGSGAGGEAVVNSSIIITTIIGAPIPG